MKQIEENKEYFGEVIHKWSPSHKNVYVITGPNGKTNTMESRIGRVAQVRLEAGEFGSDLVLLRHLNDRLCQHHNQMFWSIPEKFTAYFDDLFKETYQDDSDKIPYSLESRHSEKGFIIPSPFGSGDETPMRKVKDSIMNQIASTTNDF